MGFAGTRWPPFFGITCCMILVTLGNGTFVLGIVLIHGCRALFPKPE
jgi:hypothetical protein